jgi:hypothetical protein
MKKLRQGSKVHIKNLKYKVNINEDPDDYDYAVSNYLGKIGVLTGDIDHEYYKDDDYYNYNDESEEDNRTEENVYAVEVLDNEGDMQTVYLFKHNFEVVEYSSPKDDIEWLDRVQENFKH